MKMTRFPTFQVPYCGGSSIKSKRFRMRRQRPIMHCIPSFRIPTKNTGEITKNVWSKHDDNSSGICAKGTVWPIEIHRTTRRMGWSTPNHSIMWTHFPVGNVKGFIPKFDDDQGASARSLFIQTILCDPLKCSARWAGSDYGPQMTG